MSVLYPAQFEECFYCDSNTSQGFVVTFRDVPEANTQGNTFIEAIEIAEDAIKTAMEFYNEGNKPYPKPSEPQQGDVMIALNS